MEIILRMDDLKGIYTNLDDLVKISIIDTPYCFGSGGTFSCSIISASLRKVVKLVFFDSTSSLSS